MRHAIAILLLICIALLALALVMPEKSTWSAVWNVYFLIAALLAMFIVVEYYWFHAFFQRHRNRTIALSIGCISVGLIIKALAIGVSEQYYREVGTGKGAPLRMLGNYLGDHFGSWGAASIWAGIGLAMLLWSIGHWRNA